MAFIISPNDEAVGDAGEAVGDAGRYLGIPAGGVGVEYDTVMDAGFYPRLNRWWR